MGGSARGMSGRDSARPSSRRNRTARLTPFPSRPMPGSRYPTGMQMIRWAKNLSSFGMCRRASSFASFRRRSSEWSARPESVQTAHLPLAMAKTASPASSIPNRERSLVPCRPWEKMKLSVPCNSQATHLAYSRVQAKEWEGFGNWRRSAILQRLRVTRSRSGASRSVPTRRSALPPAATEMSAFGIYNPVLA